MEDKIILLDTDFFWEYITNNPEAVELLANGNYNIIMLSAITVAELIKGCGNKVKLAKLNRTIKDFLPLHVNDEISEKAIALVNTYHLSHNISINDAFIASTCLHYDIELATCNTSDYHYIPNLRLLQHQVTPKRKDWDSFL